MEGIRLNQVRIRGFKSIRDCTVDLDNLNVLIGPNGSGKSNFIDSLRLLQNILDGNLQKFVEESDPSSLLFRGREVTDAIEMEFSFDFGKYGFRLVPNETGTLVFESEYYVRDGVRTLVDQAHGGYESGLVGRFEGDRFMDSLSEVRKWKVFHFHDTSPDAGMRQAGLVADSLSLHHDASNLAPFLYMLRESYPGSYKDVVSMVRVVAPFFEDFVLEPDSDGELISLRWKQIGLEMVFDTGRLSDGLLIFICLATLLRQPSQLQPSIIVIDMPVLGLHPFAVSLLGEMVFVASMKRQVMVTTYSANLLDTFEADEVVVTEMSPEGSTYTRQSSEKLVNWLVDHSLSLIWRMNLIGGNPEYGNRLNQSD